jgi:hypothetical protein
MSLYEGIHRSAGTDAKARYEYLLIYSACFALFLVPIAIRRVKSRARGRADHSSSVIGETSALAANCAASSFAGL